MMHRITDPAEADFYHREGLLYFRIRGVGHELRWTPDHPNHNPPSGLMTDADTPHDTWEFAIRLED